MARVTIDGVEYLDASEVCELLAIKPATLYAYVSRGRLRSFRRGGRQRLYPAADVDALLRIEPARPAQLPAADDWMEWIN